MGRDKALVEVGGRALAARVAAALRDAGCAEVLAVGGDGPALDRLGLVPVADRWPGQGPLAALATALDGAVSRSGTPPDGSGGPLVLVAPCDLVAPSGPALAAVAGALVAAPEGVAAAVPEVGGRPEWIVSAWRPAAPTRATVTALVTGGSRRLGTLAGAVRWVPVAGIDPAALADADRPEDLPDEAGADRHPPG